MRFNSDPIRLAGTDLIGYNHVCAFFQTQDEEYRILIPFIRDGIERRDKAFHIVYPTLREAHMDRLESAGIPVNELVSKGQLEVITWDDVALPSRRFDPDTTLRYIENVIERGKTQGYNLTRMVLQKSYLLQDLPVANDLLEYEARLHSVLNSYDDVLVSTFSVARFGAGVMLDILRTHEMVIIGGILSKNPYYVPPDEFLQELRARESEPLS